MAGKTRCKRVCAGVYEVTSSSRIFRIEEVGRSEGYKRAQWNISEVIGGVPQAPFDATETLTSAKDLLANAEHAEFGSPSPGKPLIELL